MSWICTSCGQWFPEGEPHTGCTHWDADTLRLAKEASERVAEPGWIERVAAEVAKLTD